MKFGVPWSVKGIRPEARETAKEAARRSGLSSGDWLNKVNLQQATQAGPDAQPYGHAQHDPADMASVHQRLDDLTRRIEHFTRTDPEAYAPTRQRVESRAATPIGRLDRRLDQYARQPAAPPLAPTTPPQPIMAPQLAMASSPPAMPHRPNVQLPPALDHALAEIAARQRKLNGEPFASPATAPAATFAQQPSPAASAPPRATVPTQDLSGLEQQLRKITDQIETLRKPGVEEAINALRAELGDIGRALNDAMPMRAIGAIEKQIEGLSQRIADGRHAGIDASALVGIEHGLSEVRDTLRELTPAEHLVGFTDAVDGLAQKIDLIVAQKDPTTLQQLEHAITTLRSMAGNVASNETVSRLVADVQALSDRVEQVAHSAVGDVLSNLEARIEALSHTFAERAQAGSTVPPQLEALVQSLTDKIDQIQHSRSNDSVAVSHLEDRIVLLVERLDSSDNRFSHLEAIERGLADLLVHLEEMRADKQSARTDESSPAVDALKHDMARTQDALDAVHGTLGLVVDRLAMIEKNIRSERQAPPPAAPMDYSEPLELTQPVGKLAVRLFDDSPAGLPTPASPADLHPFDLPKPDDDPTSSALEQMSAASPPPHSASSALEEAFAATQPPATPAIQDESAQLPATPQLITPALAPAAPQAPTAVPAAPPQAKSQPCAPEPTPKRLPAARQSPIDPNLPPDQPLEPGSGAPLQRAHPAARIAASEAALGGARPVPGTAGGQSNFIAAARRAAQAALEQQEIAEPRVLDPMEDESREGQSLSGKMMKRVKSLLVAASIVALVVGAAQFAGYSLFHLGHRGATKTVQRVENKPTNAPADSKLVATPAKSDASTLLMPTPIGPLPHTAEKSAERAPELFGNPPVQESRGDITGSIPDAASAQQLAPAQTMPAAKAADTGDQLPAAIGSARLREAAGAGNAGAAYEVAVRFAEGRGVPVDLPRAAHWFERAASKGMALAQFRYASMLEKGLGVKKDLIHARKLYLEAAQQGNAKAMHNLAVLYAEGLDDKPDYASAVTWFRKAAQHGIADSQYNLGILYARGIGVSKNLSEAYKWFALAAAHGDKEAANKRDSVAGHLNAQELAAARHAVESFKVTPQPDKATEVSKLPGAQEKVSATPAKPPKSAHGPKPAQGPLALGAFTVGNR